MTVRDTFGRILRAPENFISDALIDDIRDHGLNNDRRDFIRRSFFAASAALVSGHSYAAADHPSGEGDPAILTLPKHSTTLGNPVAHLPYGLPSKYESNLQRRESPGLTRRRESSVAFNPQTHD